MALIFKQKMVKVDTKIVIWAYRISIMYVYILYLKCIAIHSKLLTDHGPVICMKGRGK